MMAGDSSKAKREAQARASAALMRRFIVETQLKLADRKATRSMLSRTRHILRPHHYDEVVEERICLRLCGFPGCSRQLKPPEWETDVGKHAFLLVKPQLVAQQHKMADLLRQLRSNGFETRIKLTKRIAISGSVAVQLGGGEDVGGLSGGVSVVMLLPLARNEKDSDRGRDSSSNGVDSVRKLLELLGPKDPEVARKSSPSSLRAIFGEDIANNGLYCSKDRATRDRDSAIFFPAETRKDRRVRPPDRSIDKSGLLRESGPVIKVSFKSKAWYDVTEGDRFCSANCATESELFKRALSDDPVHLRPLAAKILQRMSNSSTGNSSAEPKAGDQPGSSSSAPAPEPSSSDQAMVDMKVNEREHPRNVPPKPSSSYSCSRATELKTEISKDRKSKSSLSEAVDQKISHDKKPLTKEVESVAASKPPIIHATMSEDGNQLTLEASNKEDIYGFHDGLYDDDDLDEEEEIEADWRESFKQNLKGGRWLILLGSLVTPLTAQFITKTPTSRNRGITGAKSDEEGKHTDSGRDQKMKDNIDSETSVHELQDRVQRLDALKFILRPHLKRLCKYLEVPERARNVVDELGLLVQTFNPVPVPSLEENDWLRISYIILTMVSRRLPEVEKALDAAKKNDFQNLGEISQFCSEFSVQGFIETAVLCMCT